MFGVLLLGVAAQLAGAETLAAGDPRPWMAGADISALATFEQHGAIYRDGKRAGDAVAILRAQGVDCFRLRLFVAPDGQGVVTNDLRYTLALAKRVKASGARLLLNLHYSDTWADPSKQFKPAAWEKLAMPELAAAVRTYTREVMATFIREGVAPDFVQLGNEISNGMLWPEGQVEFARRDDTAAWARLGELQRAAFAGFAEALPAGVRPQTILHIESPDQLDRAVWFCEQATAAGLPFDIIGVSYYPDWHGDIAALRTALNTLARTFRKPVLVVETAYPWKPDEHWNDRPNMNWPLTPAGQKRFLREVAAAVREVPEELGAGICYWQPEAVPVSGLSLWVGGSCALFNERGRLLPAAAVLGARR